MTVGFQRFVRGSDLMMHVSMEVNIMKISRSGSTEERQRFRMSEGRSQQGCMVQMSAFAEGIGQLGFDQLVKGYSLAKVLLLSNAIVEFVQNEQGPDDLVAIADNIGKLRSYVEKPPRKGIFPDKPTDSKNCQQSQRCPAPQIQQTSLVEKTTKPQSSRKGARFENQETPFKRLEQHFESDPVIDRLRQEKLKEKERETMEIVQKITMNTTLDTRQRNISVSKSRRELFAEKRWMSLTRKRRENNLLPKSKKNSVEDCDLLKRPAEVVFRVLDSNELKTIDLRKHSLSNGQLLKTHRANRKTSLSKDGGTQVPTRQVWKDNRGQCSLKDIQSPSNISSNRHGGNWIKVFTYWKDHIEDIIDLEQPIKQTQSRHSGTTIIKDQEAWMATGPLASLMTSAHMDLRPDMTVTQPLKPSLKAPRRDTFTINNRFLSRLKSSAPFLKRVRIDKINVNWS